MTEAFETLAAIAKGQLMFAPSIKYATVAKYLGVLDTMFTRENADANKEKIINLFLGISPYEWNRVRGYMDDDGETCVYETLRVFHEA